MAVVQRRLLRPDDGLLLLFAPPFDKTPHDPGYIKGYLPGIRARMGRESNTHAALCSVGPSPSWAEAETAEGIFRLLNPIYHGDTPTRMEKYKVEP